MLFVTCSTKLGRPSTNWLMTNAEDDHEGHGAAAGRAVPIQEVDRRQ
jgi:hypothetical protein